MAQVLDTLWCNPSRDRPATRHGTCPRSVSSENYWLAKSAVKLSDNPRRTRLRLLRINMVKDLAWMLLLDLRKPNPERDAALEELTQTTNNRDLSLSDRHSKHQ